MRWRKYMFPLIVGTYFTGSNVQLSRCPGTFFDGIAISSFRRHSYSVRSNAFGHCSALPIYDTKTLLFQANLCMVDIDNDRITIPEDLPTFPQHKELADELREVLTKLQQTPIVPANTTNSSSSY